MKNGKVFGIVALAALIVISMAACGGSSKDSESDLGHKLTLSGQIYTVDHDNWENNEPKRAPYTGNHTIFNNGGTGTVTNGVLSFTIGKPQHLGQLTPRDSFIDWLSEYYDNVTVSNADARGDNVWLGSDADRYDIREKRWLDTDGDTGSFQEINYWYVDSDVTITATGKNGAWNNGRDTWTSANLSLKLKPGWNAIAYKDIWYHDERPNNISFSVGKPSGLVWTYEEWD